jgi:hypothetical protein
MWEQMPFHGKRWYDGQSNVSRAVHLSRFMPEEIQMKIAEHLNDHINRFLRDRKTDKLSIGVPRILSIYNHGNRQRWYDPKPQVRRAYTMMAVMPEEVLNRFAIQMLEVGMMVARRKEQAGQINPVVLAYEVADYLKQSEVAIAQDSDSIRLVGMQHDASERPRIRKPRNLSPHRFIPPGLSNP